MPLMKGSSDKAFGKNVSEMMGSGHPQKQALAAAYAMKRRAKKKMAQGGEVSESAVDARMAEMKEADKDVHPPSGKPKQDSADEAVAKLEALRRSMKNANLKEEVRSSPNDFEEDEAMSKRLDERDEEKEDMGYAKGGKVDPENEKLHPYHEPMHERSIVDAIMKRRQGVDLGAEMMSKGGEIDDEDFLAADMPEEESGIEDNHNFVVEESPEEKKAKRHAMLRKMIYGK